MSRPASILDRAISPAEAVEMLCMRGVEVSERALRERARAIGAYRQIGRAIFFTPDDLERIMEPVACSPSPSAPKVHSGSRAARSTVSELSEARARLQSLRRGSLRQGVEFQFSGGKLGETVLNMFRHPQKSKPVDGQAPFRPVPEGEGR